MKQTTADAVLVYKLRNFALLIHNPISGWHWSIPGGILVPASGDARQVACAVWGWRPGSHLRVRRDQKADVQASGLSEKALVRLCEVWRAFIRNAYLN